MAPVPDVLSRVELADRWGVTPQAVSSAIAATRAEGHPAPFPAGRELAIGTVYDRADIETWESAMRTAGRPVPGERPRGPQPRGGR